MDVASWLRSLGLEQYEATFRDNAIDDSVLPDLTDQDLEKLGVLLGHRRKLLRVIANLETTANAAPGAAGAVAAVAASPRDTAERRQVTVMFSDLVGSTALSARMDPEDLREVISAYQKCVAETVGRFGGYVAKFMGDGVLIYFGYPQAHEDDAERAVRAGLELVQAVTALKSSAPLQTRVGIATGLVVVGDLIGSGEAQERGIVGETPNLAARLQSIAEPNRVVIGEGTRKLLGNLFEVEDLGAKDLKGIAGPVRAWAALRASSVESRFEAFHASGLTDLVGREEELELLMRRWSRAKTGEGQVVLLSGEAGIGKSRLTAALLERLTGEPHTRLRYFCSPQHTDSALYPIISQMERAARLTHNDTTQVKLDKLDVLLAQTSTSKQDAALFLEMLSLPNDGRYPVLDLVPQQRRQKTLEALGSQIETLSRANPVLMIFEDAHWADPTSLEAFGRVVDQVARLRALLIVTFRPEFESPWIGRPHVTFLSINRLAQRDIDVMIDGVIGNKPLPANIRQDIIERTDGIPLFVEEMTKAVLEAESEVQRTTAAVPSPALAVPASLHASLLARLDRLGPGKEVAQIGAAIGREFSHALLAAVITKPEAELQAALNRLISAGLLFRQGLAPHASYLFKHALVQDAAYSLLLRDARRLLHARIAEALETQLPEIAESQPELLARHSTEAGLIEKAVLLWEKAARRSLARSALVEAVAQLTHALELIATLPSSATHRAKQLMLQIMLVQPLCQIRGYGSPEGQAAVHRAGELINAASNLGEGSESPSLLFSVLTGAWATNYVKFEADNMGRLSDQILDLAGKIGKSVQLTTANYIRGMSLFTAGKISASQDHFRQAISLYEPAAHAESGRQSIMDAKVISLAYLSWTNWLLGHPETGLRTADCAVKYARALDQAATLMFALSLTAFSYFLCGRYAVAMSQVDELASLSGGKGAEQWKSYVLIQRGYVLAACDKASDAVTNLATGINLWRSTGATVDVPLFQALLAGAQARLGLFESASQGVTDAVKIIETTKEKWCQAEVYRLAGVIALVPGTSDATKAEGYFNCALAVARQQRAKSWELRAAMSLARLWRDQGKVQQAHELLAPVYGWFTEGFDTRDLKDAKGLLEELAA